jgi:hypothetical protein
MKKSQEAVWYVEVADKGRGCLLRWGRSAEERSCWDLTNRRYSVHESRFLQLLNFILVIREV